MPNFIPVDFDPFEEVYEIEKITFTNEPQREIWLSCIIGGIDANLSYNESVSLEISGNLNFEAFKKAVNNLVLRHEALRATISPDGELLIIYKDLPVAIELNDLSGLDEKKKKERFAAFLERESGMPLDLVKGPLFKVFLHKTGEAAYVLTIIKHHVIADGWSTGIMLEDLGKMYNAYVAGAEIDLDAPAQISDYASAQASFRRSPAFKETEYYWLNLYKDNVPVLDLPTDHPRPSPRTYKGNRIDHPISKEMVDQLKAIGAKAGCSLVTTLLAAFEVFLYRQTHQEDIVVGLPSSGQAATGLNDVVGHCVNLLPLKTHMDPTSSFSSYLKKRKKEILDAYDHQRLTFGELIKKLYIPREPSRVALVPVMFNIDMGMDNAVFFEGLKCKLISNPRAYENFELYLNATGSKDGIMLEWSYKTDLFNSETIEAFHKTYHSILGEIIANSSISIAELAGEEQHLASISLAQEVYIAPDQTINSLIEESVRRYSDKTALVFNGAAISYQQLNERTNQLASFLVDNSIKAGDIVAISLDRSVEMLVCLLAVLKTGAVYLPLDPGYPADRIAFMLDDSSATLLLTSLKYKNRYHSKAKEVIVEDIWPKLGVGKETTAKMVTGSDTAYVLYTSGSTGKPKGVKITHRNLVNFLLSMQVVPGIKQSDRLLAITSISFDIAGLELYLPLIAGATIVLADSEATKDGRRLLGMLAEFNISIMQATPSTWQMMLDCGWEKRYPLKILSGGEALPKDLASKLLHHGAELWNMYGPTETTIWSSVKQVYQNDRQLTIGLPINNTRIYIMDEQGTPLPVDKAGEIYIGGDGVAAGYLNRAELTAEKFVPDIYAAVTGAKLYRTGDLGKMLDNGEIVHLGRIDHQVKIRGHRIEPGEIESALSGQAGIKQCVVLAQEDTPGDKRLVAYITLNDQPDVAGDNGWKDRWDTLYEIGVKDKQHAGVDQNIDGTLLEHLLNSEELTKQSAEWLHTTVARIEGIKAKRIYEIGSGAGQVLFELAPGIESYVATDYAQAAINNINERLKAEPGKWAHVKAAVAAADDFSAIDNASVDLVVINSVAQYFPNADYLVGVIRQAANALAGGGCIFIGDMQGKNSLEMYHAMDHLPRAADTTTIELFKEVIANRVRIEEELVADPAFFYLMPKLIPHITGVDVQLRKGQSLNETTKYHYDVWLYVSTPVAAAEIQITYDWQDVSTIDQLKTHLSVNMGAAIEVKNVPNTRTAKDHRLMQLLNTAKPGTRVATLKVEVAHVTGGVHPDLFWELGDSMKYNTHVRWTTDGTDGLFDVIFLPRSQKLVVPDYLPANDVNAIVYDFARAPASKKELHIPGDLVSSWKAKLSEMLPAYMVPDNFIALKSFPLTPNAKIDRNALPKPQLKIEQGANAGRIVFTKDEQLVADIWSETLGLENLKPSDDFFQLGGHSLLAVKVMVAIEKKTGKRLTITKLFEHPTIGKLARQLSGDEKPKAWDVLVPIKTTGSKDPLFLVHGGGLNILLFESLSEYFDADQPVYGLQALGLNHDTDIPPTIELIAGRYINDLLEVHPAGPYAIAGYSLGGFLAFEMARQLVAMGKEVKFLGIIDTYAGNNYYVGNRLVRVLKKIERQFHKIPFFTKSFIENPKETVDYQIIAAKRILRRFGATDNAAVPKDTFTDYEMEIYRKYSDALDAYVLSPFDIRITLFRVEKRLYFVDDPVTLGWNKFSLKGVNICEIPGDHKTFLYPPHSRQFAGIMQQVLDTEAKNRNLNQQ